MSCAWLPTASPRVTRSHGYRRGAYVVPGPWDCHTPLRPALPATRVRCPAWTPLGADVQRQRPARDSRLAPSSRRGNSRKARTGTLRYLLSLLFSFVSTFVPPVATARRVEPAAQPVREPD